MALALATSALVGVHPTLTQVPPNRCFSISATFSPADTRRAARDGPAWPPPITIESKRVVIGFSPEICGQMLLEVEHLRFYQAKGRRSNRCFDYNADRLRF